MPKVGRFIGESKPTALSDKDINLILEKKLKIKQQQKPKISFDEGENGKNK